jgi:hypothetical protein
MLEEIGSVENVPAFIDTVKNGAVRLMGFGHRVYKNYDPRATIIKKTAYDVFAVTGKNPLLDIALKLEEAALSDSYFIDRKLYPNVDFYSGLIYQAMGFPIDMFTVLFAIPRTAGWLAHWQELLGDKDQKISRPRQWYAGPDERDYVTIGADAAEMTAEDAEARIADLQRQMRAAAANLEFEKAASLRDEIRKLRNRELGLVPGSSPLAIRGAEQHGPGTGDRGPAPA